MTDIAWVTLALVVVNIVLVIMTSKYSKITREQLKESKKNTLLFNRYQVEGHITQLRIKKAEFEFKKGLKIEAETTLDDREKQCKDTIDRIVKELKTLGYITPREKE